MSCVKLLSLMSGVLFTSSLSAEQLMSQFIDPLDGQFDASTYLSNNAFGFLPVPIIITDPAVDGGLGVIGLFFHETKEEAEKRKQYMQSSENAAKHLLPPSVSAVLGTYTGNKSWIVGGGHVGFFKQGKIRYTGGVGYGDVKLNFYGFGDLALNRAVEIDTEALGIIQNVKFKIADTNIFLGLKQSYVNANISPNAQIDFDNVLPSDWQTPIKDKISSLLQSQVTTSGLGLSFEFDNRDNFFSPSSGYRYTLDFTHFDEAIGSDINYDLYEAEGLNYWPLSEKWNLGLRLAAEHANTDEFLPPYALPSLELRGVPLGRYQGDYVVASELEINYSINKRWSVSAFSGVGRVGNTVKSIKSGNSEIGKGVGFRYLIARRYGFKVGVDVAFGPEETVWYIQAGSAW